MVTLFIGIGILSGFILGCLYGGISRNLAWRDNAFKIMALSFRGKYYKVIQLNNNASISLYKVYHERVEK